MKVVEATLKRRDDELLKLTIGEESYEIPLATALTPDEAMGLKSEDGLKTFFGKYIPEEVTKTFRIGEWSDLCVIWKNASEQYAKKAKDAALGES